jgi:NAD+ synthase (glutamine-hydrolysing)
MLICLSLFFYRNHAAYYIDAVLKAVISLFSKIGGKGCFVPQYQSLGGSRSEGLALQNLQARLRLTLSYYYAQLIAALKGTTAGPLLVVATGNCDEGLSGYFTKFDCSSGDLNPIGSICKNDLRKFVNHVMARNFAELDPLALQS